MAKIRVPGFEPSRTVRYRNDLKFTKTRRPKTETVESETPEDSMRLLTNDEIEVQQAGQDWLKDSLNKLYSEEIATDLTLEALQEGGEKALTRIGNPILNTAFKFAAKLAGTAATLGTYSSGLNQGEDEQLARWKAEYEAKKRLSEEQNKQVLSSVTPFKPAGLSAQTLTQKETSPTQPPGKVIHKLAKGERLGATFGNWKEYTDNKGNVMVIEVPEKKDYILNSDDLFRKQAERQKPSSSIEQQMSKLLKMDGPERIEAAIGVKQNVDEALAKRLAELTSIAEQKSGHNDAIMNLQMNQAEDVRSGFTIRRPGALSAETTQAHDLVAQTQLQSQRTLQNLSLTDPEYQKLEAISKNLQSWQSSAGILLEAKARREAKYGWITLDHINAYKHIFDADVSDIEKTKETLFQKAQKDKTFEKLISINNENVISMLADPDIRVRQAAWKLAYAAEKAVNGETKLVERLAPIVNKREAILNPRNPKEPTEEQKKSLDTATLGVTGKEKVAKYDEQLRVLIYDSITEHAKDLYTDMANWSIAGDPKLQQIVNDVKAANGKKANYRDVLDLYFSEDMNDQEYLQKQQTVAKSLMNTLQVDKPSWLIPDKEMFHRTVKADVELALKQMMAKRIGNKIGLSQASFGLTKGIQDVWGFLSGN
jgi:hypothetical protein